MTEAEKIDRASKAQRLLSDPLYVEGFELTRQAIFEKIEQTPVRDTEGLSQLRLCLKLLNDVRANLDKAVSDGKVAQFRIDEQQRFAKVRGLFR